MHIPILALWIPVRDRSRSRLQAFGVRHAEKPCSVR